MGNHHHDCPTCGEDLRGLGARHARDCPGEYATPEQVYTFRNRQIMRRYINGEALSKDECVRVKRMLEVG